MLKIMGKAQASVTQMQAYIKRANPKVSDSVIKMIPLYITEGTQEGVRGDIAFAQSCLETGNFTFSGTAVTLSLNNFCGLGVTKTGMKGSSFKTPAEGIRAQIQHLQAYASTGRLKLRGSEIYIRKQRLRGVCGTLRYPGESKRPGVGIRAELRPEDHQYSE